MNTKQRSRSILLAATLGLSLAVVAADPKPTTWEGIERMMRSDEFKAAGLEKLSPQELEQLNQWLMQFLAYDSQQVLKTDEKIQEMQNVPVRSRIVGKFRGWDGDTTFTLDNGEVWKQRHSGRYAVNLDNPEVEIAKNLLGFYEMKIVQTGRRVGVTRLK
jgi:hypothetical protein